jgi:hypothetical protein
MQIDENTPGSVANEEAVRVLKGWLFALYVVDAMVCTMGALGENLSIPYASRVACVFLCVHAAATTPAQRLGSYSAQSPKPYQPSPKGSPGRSAHLHSCSGSFRLEHLPGGTLTHWKTPPLHGAHP